MNVHFVDVGQGDSIYFKTASGDDTVIDAGNGKGSKIIPYLKKQKVKDIEVLISTHPDADHMGGMNDVLNAYKVKSVYAPKVGHTTKSYDEFLKAVEKEGLKIKEVKKGTKVPLKGVNATFLAPVKTYGKSDLNKMAVFVIIDYCALCVKRLG